MQTKSNPSILKASNLTKTFISRSGKIKALENISFEIEEGDFVTLVGPSGCGKSTLLYMIGGLLDYTSGEIMLYGNAVKGPNPDIISFIFQETCLLPWKNAIQNVYFPISLQKQRNKEGIKKAKELLEMVGLANFMEKYPSELSGGMKQRVSIARGLIRNPKVLLLDEPFAALDEQTRTRLGFELLNIWQKTKKTLVFVTHSLTEAVLLSKRIIVLSKGPGQIIADLPIDIEYPRSYEVMATEKFGRLRDQLRKLIVEFE